MCILLHYLLLVINSVSSYEQYYIHKNRSSQHRQVLDRVSQALCSISCFILFLIDESFCLINRTFDEAVGNHKNANCILIIIISPTRSPPNHSTILFSVFAEMELRSIF